MQCFSPTAQERKELEQEKIARATGLFSIIKRRSGMSVFPHPSTGYYTKDEVEFMRRNCSKAMAKEFKAIKKRAAQRKKRHLKEMENKENAQ